MEFIKRIFGEFNNIHLKWPLVLNSDFHMALIYNLIVFKVDIISMNKCIFVTDDVMTLYLHFPASTFKNELCHLRCRSHIHERFDLRPVNIREIWADQRQRHSIMLFV